VEKKGVLAPVGVEPDFCMSLGRARDSSPGGPSRRRKGRARTGLDWRVGGASSASRQGPGKQGAGQSPPEGRGLTGGDVGSARGRRTNDAGVRRRSDHKRATPGALQQVVWQDWICM
jgi:hypothetical protein